MFVFKGYAKTDGLKQAPAVDLWLTIMPVSIDLRQDKTSSISSFK